jgi:hypothetical protein
MSEPNAIVEYINEHGEIVGVDRFYDPGLDEKSWYALEQKAAGKWRGQHLAYGCGRAIK